YAQNAHLRPHVAGAHVVLEYPHIDVPSVQNNTSTSVVAVDSDKRSQTADNPDQLSPASKKQKSSKQSGTLDWDGLKAGDISKLSLEGQIAK
ncbi:hypothetical protein HDU79_000344, partial [Rhizoclosmatium sp. JEL0117]